MEIPGTIKLQPYEAGFIMATLEAQLNELNYKLKENPHKCGVESRIAQEGIKTLIELILTIDEQLPFPHYPTPYKKARLRKTY